MQIIEDDLTSDAIKHVLTTHLATMMSQSPAESVHALDLDRLRQPNITVWSAWADGDIMGCGALKVLDAEHGEIKSMHTLQAHRRKGVGQALLTHIIAAARAKGLRKLSLETGSTEKFIAAQEMYRANGFVECGPFADYGPDPHSYFMTLEL